ncbi:MAG: ribonuclease H-like domain-containing protein, partial [Planctomycetota bacterium]|nr:ribonuclease H-like domain-containing protein [Planctomycetota bacterium]
MLDHSFIHVPGIGPHRERELWVKGYVDWSTFLARHPHNKWRDLVASRLETSIALDTLPKREAWRTFPCYADRVAYLDIETEGLNAGRDHITCVGISDGHSVEAFVQGENLEDLPQALERFDMLITYNGAQFDLPVLATVFPEVDFKRFRHIDLRFALKRLGFRGGLKAAEKRIGLDRGEGVEGLDGYFAILLWREHRRGTAGARETLLRYCLEDVVNLKPLMAHAYNELTRAMPIDVAPIEDATTPPIPWNADTNLVK